MENQTTQSPIPEPIQTIQPVQTPQPAKKNNSLIFLLSILLLIAVALAGLFYLQIQKLSKELSKYQAQPSPTPTATPDITANWQIYTSTKAKYSFKYPQGWPLVNVPVYPSCTTCIEELEFTPQYDPNSIDKEIAVVLVFKDDRIKTLENYKNIIVKGDSSIINVQDTVVGIEKAISYKLSGGIPPLPIIEYVVVKNNYYYVIRLEDSKETNKNLKENQTTFTQILSTFQFTK